MEKSENLHDDCGCIACPCCDRLFSSRKRGRFPLCETRLVFPGEYFSPGGEGYFFTHGEWHLISEAGKRKEI